MKKILLIFAIVFLLQSCNFTQPDTTVINNSSFPISFKFSRYSEDTILLNQNDTVSSKYNFSGIVIIQPEKRVTQSREQLSNIITISDLPSWEVRVENRTLRTITLAAGGWMDNLVNIPIGSFIDDDAHKGRVYTRTPNFIVASNTFPFNIQWQFRNNIFYVVIRD